MLAQKIQQFVCGQKGILNLGQICDSAEIKQILGHNPELMKDLTDLIIQYTQNKNYYNTIILNYDQFSQSLTNKKCQILEDKSYSGIAGGNYQIVGVNFKENDSVDAILEIQIDFNIEAICFKLNYEINSIQNKQENAMQDEDKEKINAEFQKSLNQISEKISQFHAYYDEFIYIIDFNIINKNNQKLDSNIVKEIQIKLYESTQYLLSNGVPLENVVVSSNLALLGLKDSQKQLEQMELSAFNSLMILSHSLPACIGGVSISYDEKLDMNTFPSYLFYIRRLDPIVYFPITFNSHPLNFQQIAHSIAKNSNSMYYQAQEYFSRTSLSIHEGNGGNYKMTLEQVVMGGIEVGDIAN